MVAAVPFGIGRISSAVPQKCNASDPVICIHTAPEQVFHVAHIHDQGVLISLIDPFGQTDIFLVGHQLIEHILILIHPLVHNLLMLPGVLVQQGIGCF